MVRARFAPPGALRELRSLMLLLAWIGGSIFAVPLLFATIGAPSLIAIIGAVGSLCLPVCWWFAVHGRSEKTKDRKLKMICFGALTVLAFAVGVVVLPRRPLTALAALFTALVLLSWFVANFR
jgi:NADH:ubiquinone oxidoreductase subunit 6 (subunit J)